MTRRRLVMSNGKLLKYVVAHYLAENYNASTGIWTDKMSNYDMSTVSGFTKPTINTNDVNGYDSVQFGSNRGLENLNALSHGDNQNCTLFFVVKTNSSGNQRLYCEHDKDLGTNNQYFYLGGSASSILANWKGTGAGSLNLTQSATWGYNVYKLIVISKYYINNTSYNHTAIRVNGTQIQSSNGNYGQPFAVNRTTLGYMRQHWNGTNLWLNGSIAEAIICNDSEDIKNIEKMEALLLEKYAL